MPRLQKQWESNLFQSTLPRGERPVSPSTQYAVGNFNPRSREGSDALPIETKVSKKISIHAPARGATHRDPFSCASRAYFNPRSREGSDGLLIRSKSHHYGFQSTLPRGERRKARARTVRRGGGFQSTLPRGERLLFDNNPTYLQNFNPRSREGSDPKR